MKPFSYRQSLFVEVLHLNNIMNNEKVTTHGNFLNFTFVKIIPNLNYI